MKCYPDKKKKKRLWNYKKKLTGSVILKREQTASKKMHNFRENV